MENASKALLIAGGVLIAILIISVLVVTINIINSNQKAKEQAIVTKQLVEFNQKWEAYNKKALYGTDIITVMKMAIENNNKMKATNSKEQYFINIILILKNNYNGTITKIDKATGEQTTEETTENSISSGNIILGNWDKKNNNKLTMQEYIEGIFGKAETTKSEDDKYIYYTYSPLANLKKAVFSCKRVIYQDGRVKQLIFEEKNI